MNFYDYVSLVVAAESREAVGQGKVSDGLTVTCRPQIEDPTVMQRQHRVVCMSRPYTACGYCPHATFELLFNANKERKSEVVACPRWENPGRRLMGIPPDGYVSVEVATCEEAPFEFCPSCPTRKNVEVTGADKSTPGWYGRWHRILKEEAEGSSD